MLTIQKFAKHVAILSNNLLAKEDFRQYLPRNGVGFRESNQESFKKYGYTGGFRNYADLTGFVVTLPDDPENLFYIRQDLKRRELLPIVIANNKARPPQAEFVSIAAQIFGFTDASDGSSISLPVASYYGAPPSTKAAAIMPDQLFNETARVDAVRQAITEKHGNWNYIQLAGSVVKRELIQDDISKQSFLRIVLRQHEETDSYIVVLYTQKDLNQVKEMTPVGSLVSIRAVYGSRMSGNQLLPVIWASSIRSASTHDLHFALTGRKDWAPKWLNLESVKKPAESNGS
jgi:hypothetical protein